MLDDPLIWVRAVHLAATIAVTGTVLFGVFIAEPSFRTGTGEVGAAIRKRLTRCIWIGSIVVVLSGAAWFVLVGARMADVPLPMALSDAALWPPAFGTDFGRAWVARLVLAALLAILFRPAAIVSRRSAFIAVGLAAALVGTLGWAGHGAADSGVQGMIHLGADILHLVAAAAWVGALVPLAMLLGAAAPDAVVRDAVLRFSAMGLVSVGTLLATGTVNTIMLVGSVTVLVETDYGRLLVLKIALFLVMLAVAGVNRMILTPQLMRDHNAAAQLAQQRLRNNSLIEAAIGAAIIVIVAVIGILPTGLEQQAIR